jgi:signal peptidase II
MIEMFASGSVLLLLDQWSKRMVKAHLANRCIPISRILRIRYVANLNGLYTRNVPRAVFAAVWLAALVSAVVLYRSGAWFQSHLALVGVGLALGGAAGNLCDILQRRYIVDFIDLRCWPVFNLANAAIVVGLLLAFFHRTWALDAPNFVSVAGTDAQEDLGKALVSLATRFVASVTNTT